VREGKDQPRLVRFLVGKPTFVSDAMRFELEHGRPYITRASEDDVESVSPRVPGRMSRGAGS